MPDRWRPWRAAWSDALYGAAGFYRRAEGPAAHFATSANAGGGVVEQFAAALARLARRTGCTTVVDVGAGRGELLTALAGPAGSPDLGERSGLELLGVDVVGRPAGLPERVGWLRSPGGADLPVELTGLDRALVVANEWLDVVPLDVLELDPRGGLRVVEVDDAGNERLGEPADADALAWCERWWPVGDPGAGDPAAGVLSAGSPGARVEVGLSRDRAWAGLLDRLTCGVAVAVDYGHRVETRPMTGTLAGHRAGRVVPARPDGSCDLTAHVALDSLPGGGLVRSQREALRELGVDAGRPVPGGEPSAYLRGLQRAGAAAALLDRGGLGGFGWVQVSVGPAVAIGQPEPPAARVDR